MNRVKEVAVVFALLVTLMLFAALLTLAAKVWLDLLAGAPA